MFFENELIRTPTLIEFLFAQLVGVAPVAVTIWVKLVLYRHRIAEDERDSPAWADHQSRETAGILGEFADDAVPRVFSRRESRMVGELAAVFDRNKPLGLSVLNPAAENFASHTNRKRTNQPAIY
jgi:hypothetical protein